MQQNVVVEIFDPTPLDKATNIRTAVGADCMPSGTSMHVCSEDFTNVSRLI
jgi:hypothetical protein